ncbi:MAG: cation transporter [Candidatus Manganitrophus sp. SB1]|nr:cation transporter [Candidatus Manganitrophus morganii]
MDPTLRSRALRLSYFTVGYNMLEGILSITAGLFAGSVALVGFGLDSFVESLSGSIMIWRFSEHKVFTPEEEARREAKAVRLIGWAFLILGAYVGYESVEKLISREIPEKSLVGIFIAVASILIMPVLTYQKYRVGKLIDSRSLVADSKQTLACVFLSVALLAGLGLNYLYDFWWADPIVGLMIVLFVIKEGYEALKEEKLCC